MAIPKSIPSCAPAHHQSATDADLEHVVATLETLIKRLHLPANQSAIRRRVADLRLVIDRLS